MTEEELLKLSAYADGEWTEPERGEIEAWLRRDPATADALAALIETRTTLDSAARNEAVPQASLDLWPSIAERRAPVSEVVVTRLQQGAALETIPVPSNERFAAVWKEIRLVKNVRQEIAPKVQPQRWNAVWKDISAQTKRVRETESATHSGGSKRRPIKAPFSSAWLWAIGAGLAASILLALWAPDVKPTTAQTNETAVATSSMSIPETQDDRFGVRVRFVPGSSDPVVSLYYKPAEQRVNALLSGDLDADR